MLQYFTENLMSSMGFRDTFLVLSGLMALNILSGVLFIPVASNNIESGSSDGEIQPRHSLKIQGKRTSWQISHAAKSKLVI